VQIIGPTEFSQRYYADELALYALQSRVMVDKVKTSASAIAVLPPQGFDAKIATLKLIRPGKEAAIDGLAEDFRHDWRMNLAFEQELDETLPDLHRALQEGRRRILTRVNQRMLSSTEPWKELKDMAAEARAILAVEFGAYASMIEDVSNGEIARLIGLCPIDWERCPKWPTLLRSINLLICYRTTLSLLFALNAWLLPRSTILITEWRLSRLESASMERLKLMDRCVSNLQG